MKPWTTEQLTEMILPATEWPSAAIDPTQGRSSFWRGQGQNRPCLSVSDLLRQGQSMPDEKIHYGS
jgi:hypothetical protein